LLEDVLRISPLLGANLVFQPDGGEQKKAEKTFFCRTNVREKTVARFVLSRNTPGK